MSIPTAITQSFHGVDKYHPVCGMDKQEKLDKLPSSSLSKDKEETQLLDMNRER